jgi:hypothetical protein
MRSGDPTKFEAYGPGLKKPVTGKRNQFHVEARNSSGERVKVGGHPVNCHVCLSLFTPFSPSLFILSVRLILHFSLFLRTVWTANPPKSRTTETDCIFPSSCPPYGLVHLSPLTLLPLSFSSHPLSLIMKDTLLHTLQEWLVNTLCT